MDLGIGQVKNKEFLIRWKVIKYCKHLWNQPHLLFFLKNKYWFRNGSVIVNPGCNDIFICFSISITSFNCGENWHDPVKCKVCFLYCISISAHQTFPSVIYVSHFYSGCGSGLRNAMMTVKHQTGLQQIPRYTCFTETLKTSDSFTCIYTEVL